MADLVLGSPSDLQSLQDELTHSADRPADPSEVAVPDRGASRFVWGCWFVSATTVLVAVLQGARNVPIQEDWHVIPAAGGYQRDFLAWLWLPNNEHRVPLPKLLYVGLLRLWTDFRVGMVFSMVLLVAVSAAFVVVVRRLRGHTRWTDAFFPLVFLHLGHWENFGWSWQITFVLATVLACGVLLTVASGRPITTVPRAAVLGACLVLIPLSGATALPFAPVMAVVLLVDVRRRGGRAATILRISAALALVLTAISMVGIKHPAWIPPSPGLFEDARTSVKVLALSFGPAAGAWWFAAGLVTLTVFGVAAVLLLRARAWSLLAFLGAAVVLAALIGHGRASLLASYGLPDRYALIVVPGLCCAYLAFEHGRPGGRARYGQAFLCAVLLALYPLNAVFGLQFRDWYHQRVDAFAGDVAAGVPLEELTYYRPIAADIDEMRLGLWILHKRAVGVFGRLNETGPGIAPVRPIDGFDTPGAPAPGWVTVGDTSTATLEGPDGEQRVSWAYEVTETWAAIGRSFDQPQDWRGMGAIAFDITSEATGKLIRVRLGLAGPDGLVDRYDSAFLDDKAGGRSIVIPWNGFGHVSAAGVYDLQGPLPIDRIVSVSFIATEPGRGALGFDRISLVPGHPQIGWPFHPSAARRSLPPWR